jgi:hypothetical protein
MRSTNCQQSNIRARVCRNDYKQVKGNKREARITTEFAGAKKAASARNDRNLCVCPLMWPDV